MIVLCIDCGQPMKEIGGNGKTIREKKFIDSAIAESIIGLQVQVSMREEKIYQCPEDKTIAIQ